MKGKIAHPQLKYSFMSGLYWICVCSIVCFTSAYMLPKGYSSSTIGLITAISNILVMLFQPLVASLIDRSERITLHSIIILFTLMAGLLCAVLIVFPDAGILIAVIFTMAMGLINILQPFVNAVSVDLEDHGYSVNFGLCRAFGSFGYAIVSTAMGFLVVRFSVEIVPLVSVLFCVLFICTTLPLRTRCAAPGTPSKDGTATAAAPTEADSGTDEQTEAPQSLISFMFSNKRFLLFLLSTACLFSSHCVTTGFLYQIAVDVGGDSSDMGLAGSIGAMLELPGMILFGLLLSRVSCKTLLRIAGIGFSIRFLAFFLADSVTTLFLAEVPQAFSYALFIPASVHYVSRLFSKADMAKAQSLVTTAITIGGIIASVAGGWLIDKAGVHTSLLGITLLGIVGAVLLFFSVEDVSGPERS